MAKLSNGRASEAPDLWVRWEPLCNPQPRDLARNQPEGALRYHKSGQVREPGVTRLVSPEV